MSSDQGSTAESVRRRRVIVEGHRGPAADLDAVRAALGDAAASVRSSALRSLERLQQLNNDDLARAVADTDVSVRRTAAELAAKHPQCNLGPLLADAEDTVIEVACWAAGEWGADGIEHVAVLASLAVEHSDSLVRESATAALGAIGHPDGLGAILAALSDKATVRRRATIALAAFDGPEVEAALTKCLDDRDWQVRQVAEDLLDVR